MVRRECARGEVAEESDFGLPAESRADQVGDFGDHEDRDDQRAGVAFEQVEACVVVRVVGVDVRVERPGVDDQCDDCCSARKISSMRSETSLRPLRPAPAAPSLRRVLLLPRCASSASRVTSAMARRVAVLHGGGARPSLREA